MLSFNPSKQEIVPENDMLIIVLKVRQIKPLVLTISRSCISGFSPKDYAEFIETVLLQRLLFIRNKKLQEESSYPYVKD